MKGWQWWDEGMKESRYWNEMTVLIWDDGVAMKRWKCLNKDDKVVMKECDCCADGMTPMIWWQMDDPMIMKWRWRGEHSEKEAKTRMTGRWSTRARWRRINRRVGRLAGLATMLDDVWHSRTSPEPLVADECSRSSMPCKETTKSQKTIDAKGTVNTEDRQRYTRLKTSP